MSAAFRSTFASLALALIVQAAIVVSTGASARAPEPVRLSTARATAVDAAVARVMREDEAVGVAIGIIENDDIVYLKGYGFADRERLAPVTTETMFRWASVSKTVTAIAALQLAERGRLDLDADVRRYVPEFADKGVVITARELLDHQGGIVHYDNGPVVRTEKKYTQPHPFADPVVALDTFKESPLVAAPGEKFSYSTYGYILLSAVVQRAGGKPFFAQVRERMLVPAGLTHIQPDWFWVDIPQRAVGYGREHGVVVRSTDTDVSWKLGAGGIISDIADFAGYAKALIDRRFVSGQTQALMWTPQKTRDGAATGWGLGFEVDDKNGRLRVAHNGKQEKTRTRLVIYPHDRLGVVVMSNSEWVDPGKFSTAIFAALQTQAKAAGD